jgi:hypothetical protein
LNPNSEGLKQVMKGKGKERMMRESKTEKERRGNAQQKKKEEGKHNRKDHLFLNLVMRYE